MFFSGMPCFIQMSAASWSRGACSSPAKQVTLISSGLKPSSRVRNLNDMSMASSLK